MEYLPEEDEIPMGGVATMGGGATIVTPKYEERAMMKEYYNYE